jgi:PAS domain S-box-containing protein
MRERTDKALRKTGEQLVSELDAMTRLDKLAMLSVSGAGLEAILGEIVDAAIAVSGADFGSIQLSSDLRIVSHRGLPQWWLDFWQNVSRGKSAYGPALERGERIIVEDVERSPIFAGTPGLKIQLKAGVRALQSTPLVSRSGKPLGMFSTHYKKPHRPDRHELRLLDLLARQAADVIEHVQITSALRQSEERYRLLAEQVTDGIFVADRHGRYLDANRAGCEMLGYKLEELLALSIPDVLAPDELQRLPAQYERLATGRSLQNEWRCKRKDGSVFIGELVGRQFPDGRLQGVLRDVTERKRAEAQAQAIMELAPVGVFVARDPQCLEIIGNRMAYDLLRMPPGTNLSKSAPEGQRPASFRVVQEGSEVPPHELPIQKAASTGKAVYGSELDFVYQDGTCRSMMGNAVPLFGADGRPQGSVGTFLDITEHKRMEEERAQETRRKDEFLALLGHELRNPLAAISNAQQLLSGGATAAQRAFVDEVIGRQVAVLGRLVDDLLDLSRIAHGQIGLQKERIDLSELLQRATMPAQLAVAARGQELLVRPPPSPVLFMGDRVRLKQIVANLLSNASKYTGREGRIELSGGREGSEVVIRCRDNGRGIPMEMQKTIFEPFTRLETTGQSSEAGLGIGLALVKRLAELHGGTVSVESGGPGTGSEFTVRLPLLDVPPLLRGTSKVAPAPQFRPALSLVVLENNPDVAQTLARALEKAGHQVTVFADGPSALSGLAGLKPDAVLLDIGLPGMDGYELAGKMRKKPNLRHALFIGLSGFKRRTHRGRSGDDFDRYFLKPVDLAKLRTYLETHARASAAEATIARRAPERRKPLRVLLVEDNADIAALTERLLRSEGLEVRTARSGRKALKTATDFLPQLILCDQNLPDMKGGEVVRRLRSDSATRRSHAVILTASSETEIHAYNRAAESAWVNEFIAKPLTSDALRRVLARLRPSRRVLPRRRLPSKMSS